MTNEELKQLWGKQTDGVTPVSPAAIWALAQASERFERTIFWRDAREWAATILVAGFFLYVALFHGTIHWLVLAAALISFWPTTYVALLRRKRAAPEMADNLIGCLHGSIASVRHQIGLLRSVHRWYLGPIALSILLVFVDLRQWERGPVRTAAFFGMGIALFAGIWMLNRHAVRKDLEPRLRELERVLTGLLG